MQVLIIFRPHGSRRILNQEQLLALCNAYVPSAGPAKHTNCEIIEFQEKHFLEDLALLQRADVLVRLPQGLEIGLEAGSSGFVSPDCLIQSLI